MIISSWRSYMDAIVRKSVGAVAVIGIVAILSAGCQHIPSFMGGHNLSLKGSNEVPPVKTKASGSGRITVSDNREVSGSITISDMKATAAHIHLGRAGTNGPVVVPLVQTGDNVWSVPVGSKLTSAQYKNYQAGELYVNVHSAAHKDGEIRAQLNSK